MFVRIITKIISRFHWHLMLWLGLPMGRAVNLCWWSAVPDTDSGSLFHLSHHCGIGYFRRFITQYFSYSHRPLFMKLSEMTDADKGMNPRYFRSDPIEIRIRINPEVRIRIPDHFWLRQPKFKLESSARYYTDFFHHSISAKFWRFSTNISLYIGNNTRQGHWYTVEL